MRTHLQFLKPGTRFRVADMPTLTGTLISASASCATVRIDGELQEVEIPCVDGTKRRFTAQRTMTTTWALATVVEPIPADKPACQRSSVVRSKPTKLSAIDAAAQVLATSTEPMNAKELIVAMESQGLWKSPGGKTPHATLYSAILREIAAKGKDARFAKAGQGKFKIVNR